MLFRNRLFGSILVLVAGFGLLSGCQTRDGSIPTEADRAIQASGEAEDAIIALIDELFDPALGKSVKRSFESIVSDLKKNKVAVAQSKTLTLTDYILDHYQKDNLITQNDLSGKVGTLNMELLQYVDLITDGDNAAAAACLPGDLLCEAFPDNGLAEIPVDLITEPFTLIAVEVDCGTLDPGINFVEPCFEVTTIPEQTFGTSASSSLSLSQSDIPVVGVCADFADGLIAGQDVFLYHAHDGVIEQTPFENISVCGDALASRWANPILARFQPVLQMLGPQPLYAAVGLGSVAGGINNFSTLFACEPGCISTTTTLTVVSGGPVLHPGGMITIRVDVSPAPPDAELGVLLITRPIHPIGATTVSLTGGTGEHTYTCGSAHIQVGQNYTAEGRYRGSISHDGSSSGETVSFSCLPS